ncbi:MAG: hypothetical protein E5X86_26610 [Mesorhizobium sp.]|uniref:hypothetical protein n=1 Tax=Mesorhizobium sp. TaxID=1871066 RepID=UPI000FE47ED6|nr:hypothetical protein [Mesorhizobium sp.]RWK94506.1 MAG: hypothetical protein EOR53_18010 [Mesorhizobium sp.]TIO14025.1 MAG: hypothetical protein E5X86_26610 [Mesorhizobium sp.]TIQ18928.1 MAG: hypothetical protein E5X51_23700 [Mesorhizobium sp.]TIQ51058.1 MAG: hypothetical protein E5X61_12075 [Mesorhizobium sp.]
MSVQVIADENTTVRFLRKDGVWFSVTLDGDQLFVRVDTDDHPQRPVVDWSPNCANEGWAEVSFVERMASQPVPRRRCSAPMNVGEHPEGMSAERRDLIETLECLGYDTMPGVQRDWADWRDNTSDDQLRTIITNIESRFEDQAALAREAELLSAMARTREANCYA